MREVFHEGLDDQTTLSWVCLWREETTGEGTPGGDCTTTRPYVRSRAEVATASGETATVCALQTTSCQALTDYRTTSCSAPGTGDAECGAPDVDDGLCRPYGMSANRCTYACLSSDDCPDGSSCDTGATPRFCTL